jgi:endonuclease/exonuclease/phosphatase family metal-dependent hydrolase
MRVILPLCLLIAGFGLTVRADSTITIIAWNVESGGSDPEVIARQLAEFTEADVIALSEVSHRAFQSFCDGAGEQFETVTSVTGGGDRLQILYDDERFELIRQQELDEYRDYPLNNGNHRSPLVAHLREHETGVEFQVMVNHLARRDENLRNQQAIGLREWARDQTLPTVAVGDYNLDYAFVTQRGNEAFVEIMRDGVWDWIEPVEFIDTNWSDSDNDGFDNYPDSMLDFAFVAGPAKDWQPVCNVIVRDGDFPDDATTSDHRPIELRLQPE